MSEKPTPQRVHVKVIPCFENDPDSDSDYYISVELNTLECQLQGERFVQVARKAMHRALQNGKITLFNDRLRPSQSPADSRTMPPIKIDPVSTEEIVLTPLRRLAGNALTKFTNTIRIDHTNH